MTRAPAEELKEFEYLLAEHESEGGVQAGANYFLVSHKWLANWRQWVGHSTVTGRSRRRAASGERSPGEPPELSRASSGPDSAPSSPKFAALPMPQAGGASSSASAPNSPSLRGATPPSALEFSLEGLEEPRRPHANGRSPADRERDYAWTKERPGPIDNDGLLDRGADDGATSTSGLLKSGLRERFDFEIVPESAWLKLQVWYRGGPAICRRGSRQPSGEVQVEVYGLRLHARLVDPSSEKAAETEVELGRSETVTELREHLRSAFSLPAGRPLRLWRLADGQRRECLTDLRGVANNAADGRSLESLRLLEDQVLLVEQVDEFGNCPVAAPPQSSPSSAPASPSSNSLGFSLPPPPTDRSSPSTAAAHIEELSAPLAPTALPPVREAWGAEGEDPPAGKADDKESEREVSHPTGIENLRNTCFMNSSLQCLANISQLKDYFMSPHYMSDVEISGKVTETTKGELAVGFEKLLRQLWGKPRRAIAPWAFKELVAKFASGFDGYRQHDSMEFIEYLIDGLKEDVNRVKGKKLYVERADSNGRPDDVVALEAGNKFLLRNDSVVDDIFVGFLKSSTACPEPDCRHESVVFDPFLSLKVPLQSPQQLSETTFVVTVFPVANSLSAAMKLSVAVKKYGSVDLLIAAAAKAAGLQPEHCLLVELYQDRIYKFFEASDLLADVAPADILVLYELRHPEAFQLSTVRRWGSGEVVKEGDLVETMLAFSSNSQDSHELRRGLSGKVLSVDEDGDASIKFDGIHEPQWVFRDFLGNLKTDLNMDSDEKRLCPHDNKAPKRPLVPCSAKEYTLRELVDAFHPGYSLQDLRDYWRDSMKPTQEPEGPPPRSGVVVFFRDASERLFGAPVVFDAPRQSSAQQLADAVSEELAERLGNDAPREWTLFKAYNIYRLAEADERLLPEDEDSNDDRWLREREYLVADWPEEAPEHVRQLLVAATPQEPASNSDDEKDQSVDLVRCFGWLTEQEQLSEHDAVYCCKCKEHRQMFKKVDLWSVPPVLVLQLKRFAEDMRQRLSTPVNFPLEGLDLRQFCLSEAPAFPADGCVRAGQRVRIHGLESAAGQKLNGLEGVARYLDSGSGRFCVQLAESDPSSEWKRMKPENLEAVSKEAGPKVEALFDLAAVCKHIGDARFGHYVAYVRSTVDGKWRLFDDESVNEVPAEEVARQRVGAYVLFYVRRDIRPESWAS